VLGNNESQILVMNQQAVDSKYQCTLDYEARKQYKEKLILKSEQIPDPYAVPDKEWRDDVMEWEL